MAIGCGHTRQCHARHSNHGLRRSSRRIQGVFPIEIAFNSQLFIGQIRFCRNSPESSILS